MKHLLFVSLLLCWVLAACGKPAQPVTPPEEQPLLTDVDFDKAVLQLPNETLELTTSNTPVVAWTEQPFNNTNLYVSRY